MKQKWLVAIFLTTMSTAAFADETDNFVPTENITKWKGDSYQGTINLTLKNESDAFSAQLETDDLTLVSLTADQFENYARLFTNPAAVEKYADGQPWTEEEVGAAVLEWTTRWEVDRDPFSAFAIFEKKAGNAFVGHIVLGHGSRYGQSELAVLLSPSYHKIGYATQAVSAVLYGFVPHLLKEQYLANRNNSAVVASPLRSIHATGRFDDTFSGQAMIRSGMRIGESDLMWGAQRFHYVIRVDEILNSLPQEDDGLYDTGD